VNWDDFGYWFDYGGTEKWKFKGSGSLTFSLFAGWDFPLSPFRMELEYARTSFKVKSFTLDIFSQGDVTVDDSLEYAAMDFDDVFGSDGAFSGSYSLDFGSSETLDVTTNTLMVNTFFEIPGLDAIDPYIGVGVGTFSMDVKGGWVQPDWSVGWFMPGESGACGVYTFDEGCDSDVGFPGAPANMITGIKNRMAFQIMLGVEYRIPETPYIFGLEYRNLKVDNAEDKNNNSAERLYVWDNWNITLNHSQFMMKFRYDFVGDEF
jgi:opacity protein-like surface antigen